MDGVSTGSRRMGQGAAVNDRYGFIHEACWASEQAGVNTSRVEGTVLAVGLSPTHKGNIQ